MGIETEIGPVDHHIGESPARGDIVLRQGIVPFDPPGFAEAGDIGAVQDEGVFKSRDPAAQEGQHLPHLPAKP